MKQSADAIDAKLREQVRLTVHAAARDPALVKQRFDLAKFSSESFTSSGEELHVLGHIVGPDRIAGTSPFGHGSDEAVAVSTLLRIGGQLISASADLFHDGRSYAAAALLRQIVEVEYLAWAMEERNGEGERWLRSDKAQREQFFKPAKLRKAAGTKFRGQDYGYHCEFGGHPVPGATALFQTQPDTPQLLLSDLLGHTGRIWEHFVGWAKETQYGTPILSRTAEMRNRFMAWKSADTLLDLPPPP